MTDQYQAGIAVVIALVKRLGGRVSFSSVEMVRLRERGAVLVAYEDHIEKRFILEVHEGRYRQSSEDPLRHSPSPQRSSYGGDGLAAALQSLRCEQDYADYVIVEGDMPQLPKPADSPEAATGDQSADQ